MVWHQGLCETGAEPENNILLLQGLYIILTLLCILVWKMYILFFNYMYCTQLNINGLFRQVCIAAISPEEYECMTWRHCEFKCQIYFSNLNM